IAARKSSAVGASHFAESFDWPRAGINPNKRRKAKVTAFFINPPGQRRALSYCQRRQLSCLDRFKAGPWRPPARQAILLPFLRGGASWVPRQERKPPGSAR